MGQKYVGIFHLEIKKKRWLSAQDILLICTSFITEYMWQILTTWNKGTQRQSKTIHMCHNFYGIKDHLPHMTDHKTPSNSHHKIICSRLPFYVKCLRYKLTQAKNQVPYTVYNMHLCKRKQYLLYLLIAWNKSKDSFIR